MGHATDEDEVEDIPCEDASCIVCGEDGQSDDNQLLKCINNACWHLVHYQCSMPSNDTDALGVLCTRCNPEPRYSTISPLHPLDFTKSYTSLVHKTHPRT